MECTPSQARELIMKTYLHFIERQLEPPTFILIGPPGIGKSESVMELGRELAEKLNKEFIVYDDKLFDKIMSEPDRYFVYIDIRLSLHDPGELTGIPREAGRNAIMFKPLTWGLVLSEAAGILFLDELTNVQREDLLAAAYRVLWDRYLGYVKLSRNVLVIAAGNRREDSSIVRKLPAPLINRTCILYIKVPTVEEWRQYMEEKYGDRWCRTIYYYLKSRPEHLYVPPDDVETLENFPTPRSWTKLALLLGNNPLSRYSKEEIELICIGTIGKKLGPIIAQYIIHNVPTIDDLLTNPEKWLELPLDVKLDMLQDVARRIEEALRSNKNDEWKRLTRLLKYVFNDSEEIGLTLLQIVPEDVKVRFIKKLSTSLPEVKRLLDKLEEKMSELE
ncbi:MAG: ATP-binding protein [Crenarchaeota archaeon]|nr:ATP-binding protein [Thermoproteota archaeon]